jgi:hypothetical protein
MPVARRDNSNRRKWRPNQRMLLYSVHPDPMEKTFQSIRDASRRAGGTVVHKELVVDSVEDVIF